MTILLKVWSWFVRRIGAYTLMATTLLLIGVSSVAYGYADIVRGIEPLQVTWLAFCAVLLGWLLGRSKVGGWWFILPLVLAGLALDLFFVGALWLPLGNFLRAGLSALVARIQPESSFDPAILRFAMMELNLAISKIFADLEAWLRTIQAGVPVYNATAVSLLWGLVLWLVAAWAGYFQRRHKQPFVALLPAGVLLAAGLSYTRASTLSLFPALFALLALTTLSSNEQRVRFWEQERIDYPEDVRLEIRLAAGGIIIGLLLIALIVPRLTLRPIINFVYNLTEAPRQQVEPVIESFGLVQEPVGDSRFGTASEGGLPRQQLLGSGPELSEQLVMSVRMTGGIFPEEVETLGQPFYWRSLTYDQYTGDGWRSSETFQQVYSPGELISVTELPSHRLVEHEVRLIADDRQLIYTAGELLAIDEQVRIAWRETAQDAWTFGYPGDFFGALLDANDYRVRAWVPLVSETSLRQADAAIPGWILNRYLALPAGIPVRVYDLAQQLTRDQDTTYDRVRAIETYLREITYDLDLPEPPAERDLVDYFLFDLRRGYCDYYASAMVVMARSVGIPARLVTGYAQGTYDRANDRYLVSEAEAHSWVEVYFSGNGWIPFEPTAGLPAIQRPVSAEQIPSALRDVSQDDPVLLPWYQNFVENWQRTVLILVVAVLVVPLLWWQIDAWWLYQFPAEQSLRRLYRRLYRHGKRLGVRSRRGETPHEFSTRLVERLHILGKQARWQIDFQSSVEDIQKLTELFARSEYSPHPAVRKEQWQGIDLWRRLRSQLLVAWIMSPRIFRKKIQSEDVN